MRRVRIRLRLVQRLHDGGNRHGQRCDLVDERERKNDDEMMLGFAVCSGHYFVDRVWSVSSLHFGVGVNTT